MRSIRRESIAGLTLTVGVKARLRCSPLSDVSIFRALGPLKLSRGNNEANAGADLDGLAKMGMALLSPDLDGTNYFDVHHTANDTLSQVDPAALRQSIAAFAVSAWLGAQNPGEWERVTAAKPPRR